MGIYKQRAIDEAEHRELAEHLRKLVEAEAIQHDTAARITLQVIDHRLDSLSDKQRYIFNTHVWVPFCTSECQDCGCGLPLSEAWDWEECGVASTCSYCERKYERFMRE